MLLTLIELDEFSSKLLVSHNYTNIPESLSGAQFGEGPHRRKKVKNLDWKRIF